MENRISELLDCLEDAGQDLKPRGGNAARVRAKTFAKLHGAETGGRSRRRARPLTVLIAAAVALTLLCGTVFAAWKLGAFRFAEEFGPAGEALDSHAQTYESNNSEAIDADYGFTSWVKAEAGNYNLTLLRLTTSDTELRATVDVSPKQEGVPALRDSGLRLSFADYETLAAPPRRIEIWKDRVELRATLTEPLAADAEIRFSLSGPGQTPALASFRLDALDKARQEPAESERVHYATAAETADYRFSLRTLTASASTIYAVLDVEARTDYGRANLDRVPELAVYNRSRQNSGTLLDARLVGSEEGLRRYLLGFRGDQPLNEPGDSICFEILELFEAGDLAGHPYYLFDVLLEDLVPDGLLLTAPQGEPEDGVTWLTVRVETMGMTLEGIGEPKRYDRPCPTVILVFRDGSRESILYDWGPGEEPSTEHFAEQSGLVGRKDGSVRDSISFRNPLELSTLAAVIVDGQRFPVEP